MTTSPRRMAARARYAWLIVSVAVLGCTTAVESTPTPDPLPTSGSLTPAPTITLTPTPPGSPTPPATPTGPATSPTPWPPAEAWQRLTDFPAEDAIEVTSATATADGGFVAVGFRATPGESFFGRREGVVWRSADGLAWVRDVPAAFDRATLEQVVSLGSDVFAFGVVSSCPLVFFDPCTDDADAGNTVWRSSDGVEWQELPQWASLVEAVIDGVTVADGRLIAYGATGDDLTPALWTSADGETWSEQGQLGDLNPISAFGAGPGVVALGTRYNQGTEELEAVAVFSPDGSTFEPASVPAGISAAIEDVTYGAAGWVAVGYGDGLSGPGITPVTLISADGREWRAVDAQPELAGVGFHRVVTVPGGYLAIGFDLQPPDFDREQALSFYSRDGTAWAPLGDLTGAQYTHFKATALGDQRGMIVFVAEHDELGGDHVINVINGWFAPIETLTIP
jgi:hypothetical protein